MAISVRRMLAEWGRAQQGESSVHLDPHALDDRGQRSLGQKLFDEARYRATAVGTVGGKASTLRCAMTANARTAEAYTRSPRRHIAQQEKKDPHKVLEKKEAGAEIRTPDLLITNQLLYRLSYASIPARVGYPSSFIRAAIRIHRIRTVP